MLLSSGCWQSWGNTSPGMFVHELSMLSSHSWSSAEIYLSLPWFVQFHEAGSTCLLSVWFPLQSIYSCKKRVLRTIVYHISSCLELTHFFTFCRQEWGSPATLQRKGTDLGHQANLKESSKSKELAELRLQVLVVVIANDACESKKEIMRHKNDLQSKDREHTIKSWSVVWQYQD